MRVAVSVCVLQSVYACCSKCMRVAVGVCVLQ